MDMDEEEPFVVHPLFLKLSTLQILTNISLCIRIILLVIDRILYFITPNEYLLKEAWEIWEIPRNLSTEMTLVVLIITLIIHGLAFYGVNTKRIIYLGGVFISSLISFFLSVPAGKQEINPCCVSEELGDEERSNCSTLYTWTNFVRESFAYTVVLTLIIAMLYRIRITASRRSLTGEILYQIRVCVIPNEIKEI